MEKLRSHLLHFFSFIAVCIMLAIPCWMFYYRNTLVYQAKQYFTQWTYDNAVMIEKTDGFDPGSPIEITVKPPEPDERIHRTIEDVYKSDYLNSSTEEHLSYLRDELQDEIKLYLDELELQTEFNGFRFEWVEAPSDPSYYLTAKVIYMSGVSMEELQQAVDVIDQRPPRYRESDYLSRRASFYLVDSYPDYQNEDRIYTRISNRADRYSGGWLNGSKVSNQMSWSINDLGWKIPEYGFSEEIQIGDVSDQLHMESNLYFKTYLNDSYYLKIIFIPLGILVGFLFYILCELLTIRLTESGNDSGIRLPWVRLLILDFRMTGALVGTVFMTIILEVVLWFDWDGNWEMVPLSLSIAIIDLIFLLYLISRGYKTRNLLKNGREVRCQMIGVKSNYAIGVRSGPVSKNNVYSYVLDNKEYRILGRNRRLADDTCIALVNPDKPSDAIIKGDYLKERRSL